LQWIVVLETRGPLCEQDGLDIMLWLGAPADPGIPSKDLYVLRHKYTD